MTIWQELGRDWGFDAEHLQNIASRDPHLGYDAGNKDGTPYTIDGQILYSLLCVTKSQVVLELGTNTGGGTTHIAQALHDTWDRDAIVHTVENNPDVKMVFPEHLRHLIATFQDDINLFVPRSGVLYDFIYEDGNHSEYQVHVVYQNLPRILRPGGWILSHDTGTDGVGDYIRSGMQKAGYLDKVKFYTAPPSPCGFSLMRHDA